MARFLSWEHLSRGQIVGIRAAPKQPGAPTARQLLQQYVSEQLCQDQLHNDIVLDLYAYALQQGQTWGFDDERLSCLFGIIKEVHTASVGKQLTIERSFAFFKDTLINHSIQRPPFSTGVFSQSEMRSILDWVLGTYYRHYKLYQYAFTNRVTMSVSTYHPSSLVESAPLLLPPLSEALTEEQHQQQLDEQQQQLEEQRSAEEAAAAVAAEAAREVALQEAYEASLPDDTKERVMAALQREVFTEEEGDGNTEGSEGEASSCSDEELEQGTAAALTSLRCSHLVAAEAAAGTSRRPGWGQRQELQQQEQRPKKRARIVCKFKLPGQPGTNRVSARPHKPNSKYA